MKQILLSRNEYLNIIDNQQNIIDQNSLKIEELVAIVEEHQQSQNQLDEEQTEIEAHDKLIKTEFDKIKR